MLPPPKRGRGRRPGIESPRDGMTTVTHAAVGGLIGSAGLGSPVSFLLGMGSHLPLDLVPHWDIKRPWIDTVLTLGTLGVLYLLFGSHPVFWGAGGAALPDLEHLLPLRRKLFPGHGRTHGRRLGWNHAWHQAAIVVLAGAVIAGSAL